MVKYTTMDYSWIIFSKNFRYHNKHVIVFFLKIKAMPIINIILNIFTSDIIDCNCILYFEDKKQVSGLYPLISTLCN